MATNLDLNDESHISTARRIIRDLVPEDARLARGREPSHLNALASELGVRDIQTRHLTESPDHHTGVDAVLIPRDSGYSVIINKTAPLTRQRFSLAHELAHILLLSSELCAGRPDRSTRYRSESSTVASKEFEERLCDEIAAELLMPESLFKEDMESQGRFLENLPKWANSFGTSLTATAIRYRELLPEPCHLIKWRKSLYRRGVIYPAWQKRNRVLGPSLQPVVDLKAPNAFRAVQESWDTLRNSRSLESLLVRYWSAGRAYLTATNFETESIGFGGPRNRTVLSMVYLARTGENRLNRQS